jgi:thermostable 8-oxoguanine DNA glycosylase
MKTISELHLTERKITELQDRYSYQKETGLTDRLDDLKEDFNQSTINEIVLWKVNRYASLREETILLLNSIDVQSDQLDIELTKSVLKLLLEERGIRLPMASTILRFKNRNLYQIIDKRAYRVLYGKKLKMSKNYELCIEQYMKYLSDLRSKCEELDIVFSEADRVLYQYDREVNKGIPLDGDY